MKALTNAEHLLGLLASERAALVAGDLAAALARSEEKLRLLGALEQDMRTAPERVPVTQLDRIRSAARENAQHLNAIRNGLQNAISRLDRLSHDTSVGAYSSAGAHVPFKSAAGTYLRKV